MCGVARLYFSHVLRKGAQSNWGEKQARICVLCDAFCSHTALPRAKGMHQPRDSAVFPLKTNNHSSSKQYNHSATVTHTRAATPERTHARGIAPREKRACVGHGRAHDQQGTGPGNGPRRPEHPRPKTQDPGPKGKQTKGIVVCVVWVALYLSTPHVCPPPKAQRPRSAQEELTGTAAMRWPACWPGTLGSW